MFIMSLSGSHKVEIWITNIKLDELVKSPKTVIPAKAGIHK